MTNSSNKAKELSQFPGDKSNNSNFSDVSNITILLAA